MSKQEFIEVNTRFWQQHGANPSELKDEYLIVDLDTREPVRFMLSCILAKLLQLKYKYKLIGIIPALDEGFQELCYSYGININYHHYEPVLSDLDVDANTFIKRAILHKDPEKLRKSILNLSIDGLWIGDLIYDSHLRMSFLPTLTEPTKELVHSVNRAYQFYLLCDFLFRNYDIAGCVLTHRIYIQYGMLGRYCLQKGKFAINTRKKIPACALRRYTCPEDFYEGEIQLTEKLSDYLHTLDIDTIVAMGKKAVIERINGVEPENKINTHAYHEDMRVYSREELVDKLGLDPEKPIVVVMLQAFPESHVFSNLVFDDYVEWLEETCKAVAKITEANWVIRNHPYHFGHTPDFDTEKHIASFLEENEHIAFAPLDWSLRNIKEIVHSVVGIGDILVEVACEGIPCVSPGWGTLHGTDAYYEASTRREYYDLLRRAPSLPRLNDEQLKQAHLVAFRFLADEVNTRLIPYTTIWQFGVDVDAVYKEAAELLRTNDFDSDALVTHFNYMLDNGHDQLLPYEKLGIL